MKDEDGIALLTKLFPQMAADARLLTEELIRNGASNSSLSEDEIEKLIKYFERYSRMPK